MTVWIAGSAAMAGGLLLTPLVRLIARRYQWVDHSDGKRKLHQEPIPLLGGIAVCASVVIGVLSSIPSLSRFAESQLSFPMALLMAIGISCAVGCVDDCVGLRVRWKLLGQFLATVPLLFTDVVPDELNVLGLAFPLSPWAKGATVIWLITLMNAMNFIDGMDGLASVVGFVAAATLGLIAWDAGQSEAVILAASLMGALLGFLLHNAPPASIFMGDAGSMTLGLAIGALSLKVMKTSSGSVDLALMIAVSALPLFDLFSAILRRTLRGQYVWHADREHVHHQLVDKGYPRLAALLLLGAVAATGGLVSYTIAATGSHLIPLVCLASVYLFMILSKQFGYREWEILAQLAERRVVNMASKSLDRRLARQFESLDQQSLLPFEDAWQSTMTLLQQRGVDGLELTPMAGAYFAEPLSWGKLVRPNELALGWQIQFHCGHESGYSCTIRAHFSEGFSLGPFAMMEIREAIKRLGRHWIESSMAEVSEPNTQRTRDVLRVHPAAAKDKKRGAA